jgi:hypothetical protein
MTIPADTAARLDFARAALSLAAERPWRDVTIFDIASAARRPVADFYPATPADALDCIEELFDRQMAEGAEAAGGVDLTQRLRDRLFDLLMLRFEAMEPHRAALLALDPGPDPVATAALHHRHVRLAGWAMALAGMDSDGVAAKARAQGLALLVAQVRAAWRQDTAGDFARTMAALDKGLRRAEETFGRFAGFTGSPRPQRPEGAGGPAGPQAGYPQG